MKFSVIVPVYEHWHLVPTLLQCLEEQALPRDAFEILLVDNGSSEFTPPDTLPANTRVLECHTPGSYAARNMALREARGDWLVFTDADCRPTPHWLQSLDHATAQAPHSLLAGSVDVVSDADQPNAFEIYDMVKDIPQAWYVHRGYAATANLAVPREVMNNVGEFDATRFSGGDAEFCKRAVKAGYPLKYIPEAEVKHPARDSWDAIATKARRVKAGQVTAGSAMRRLSWSARTLTPPLIATYRFLRNRHHTASHRATAVAVQYRVWALELRQLTSMLRGNRERR